MPRLRSELERWEESSTRHPNFSRRVALRLPLAAMSCHGSSINHSGRWRSHVRIGCCQLENLQIGGWAMKASPQSDMTWYNRFGRATR